MKNIKLLKVTGYYQEGNNFNFVEEKSWRGKVILREDLTFEGIVMDNSTQYNFDRYLYGTLVEYNGTSLMKFSNHGLCPCSFFGMSNGKEILGTWAFHDYIATSTAGRCKIIFEEIPEDEGVIGEISEKIDKFKAEMDCFSKKLYQSFVDNMTLTVEKFIKNMNENKAEIEKEIGCTLKKLEI